MAVQAQYTSNAFSSNFKTDNNRDASNVIEDDGCPLRSVLNDSRSRKRERVADSSVIQQFQFPISSKIPRTAMLVSNNEGASNQCQNRIVGLAATTTSGRFMPPEGEIDAFIRLHNAKVRSDICKIQAKHYNQLLQVIDNQASNRIMEKDTELASLKRKQTKLEDRLNQVTNANGFWCTAAMNSEATVSALKASLDQVLAKCHVASSHEAADVESCCYGGDNRDDRNQRLTCRVCGEVDVSVLVLPCRHLCLCAGCEPGVNTCPICYGAKSVGIQVFLD